MLVPITVDSTIVDSISAHTTAHMHAPRMQPVQIAPVVIFPLTVGEGCLLLYFAATGPNGWNGAQVSWFMQLVIASTVAVMLFYLLEASSGRCVLTSTFERPLEPTHYLMWMVTMVIDSVTLHMLMAVQRRARGEEKLLCERKLAEVILCTQAIFFAAFYGNLLRPVSALNLLLMGTAFASFVVVLYRNYEVVKVATMDVYAIGERLALRFLFIRRLGLGLGSGSGLGLGLG